MNPVIKKKWLRALRSGKYKRATHMLRRGPANNPRGFCCLGVLAAVEKQQIDVSGDGLVGCRDPYEYFRGLIGEEAIDDLVCINDASGTRGFTRQIKYIEKNL